MTLTEGDGNPLAKAGGELLELRAEFEPGAAAEVAFTVRGTKIVYDAKEQEIVVNNHRAPAPLRNGKQRLTVYADRTALEVFASDGLTYVPMPLISKAEERSVAVAVKGGAGAIQRAGSLRIEIDLAQVTSGEVTSPGNRPRGGAAAAWRRSRR